jgi:glycerol-3-phosphate dehydrogenase
VSKIADRIAVVGAGAWGTALANVIAAAPAAKVTLFARDAAAAGAMVASGERALTRRAGRPTRRHLVAGGRTAGR